MLSRAIFTSASDFAPKYAQILKVQKSRLSQKRPKNEQIDILPFSHLYVCKGNKNNSIKSQFGDFILAKNWRQLKKIIESVFKAKVESTYSSKCALKGRAFFHLQKVESTYNSGADFNLNDKHPSPQPKGKGEGCLQDIVIYCYADAYSVTPFLKMEISR